METPDNSSPLFLTAQQRKDQILNKFHITTIASIDRGINEATKQNTFTYKYLTAEHEQNREYIDFIINNYASKGYKVEKEYIDCSYRYTCICYYLCCCFLCRWFQEPECLVISWK